MAGAQVRSKIVHMCISSPPHKNVHQGTSTPLYTGGRFSFRFEETLHRFQNMVIDKMLVHEPTRYRIPDGDVDYHDLLAAPDPLLPAAASG